MDTTSKVDRGETFVPRPDQARFSTLGFDALVADYYWLTAVQIVGGERSGVGRHAALLARLIDVVTTVDPWVGHPYRFAAIWLTDSIESVRSANALLERGIAYHPLDWRNRHYLGFNHFYYLLDDQKAAEVLEGAVRLPKAPAYLAKLAAKLRTSGDSLETAAAFLEELARSSEDPYAEAEYRKSLDELETERRARWLDEARVVYQQRAGRDIERVEDLLRGPYAVLPELPPAHPHFDGFRWKVHPETGRIVSSFYGSRYAPHVPPFDRTRRPRWREQMQAEREAS
jgi:hypothetical protein